MTDYQHGTMRSGKQLIRKILSLVGFLLLSMVLAASIEAGCLHHDLQVRLDPHEQCLFVRDTITLPPDFVIENKQVFVLHGQCEISSARNVVLTRIESGSADAQSGPEYSQATKPYADVPLGTYQYVWSGPVEGPRSFSLEYHGRIDHPIVQLAVEYARGFSETPGIICEQGVYLAGSSCWLPQFEDTLVSFRLELVLPPDWDAVSQGQRMLDQAGPQEHRVVWQENNPQEEVYLVAGPLVRFEDSSGPVNIMAYLRTSDQNQASKYIDTTRQYLTLYQQLIGPFPYQKFALVENFWETGYGMPSFTLLGPQVIRFPFILHSSYPHELLHNWWGNSVYVDWARGNWCEGITVYLADHLIKEQRGQGLEYRRTSLQNFSAYVDDTNDFPLETFLSRKDAASEAIGYGKAMMVMHMLRRRFGDQLFQKALARFYTEMRWQKASFEDLRRSFEQVTGEDLGDWFAQWLTRKGAPQIELTRIELEPTATGSGMTLTLKQVQPGPVYQLDIPVIIYGFDQKTVITHNVRLTEREQTTTIALPVQPVLVEVDPDFDVFRRLDPNEVPPSLSQLFGADSVALVLPPTDDPLYGAYKALAETWALDQKDTFTVFEAEQIKSFPRNEAVWLFGRKNPFQAEFERGLVDYDLTLTKEDLVYEGNTIPRHGNSIILTCRVPDRSDQVLAWLFSDNPDAPTGLSRKLPHYGSYSVLVFEGDQPTNIVKGKWPVVGSPMMAYLGNPDESRSFQKPSRPPRPALAELPPVFSEQRIHDHVQFLASQEMAGRGLATPELDRAADYIAARFKEYGLDPAGDKDSFFQSWNQPVSGKTGPILMKNVIGLVAGSRSDWTDQAVVVCAHYDHLGHGWPVVHSGDEGKIHPGADDNASGVAVLLELARHFSHAGPPERNLIFIAFTAEECGRLGSQHFVDHLSEYPYQTVTAALNLDTVGRLGQGKVLVLGGASASEWRHIFMGCSYTTGVSSELVTQNLDSSDQTSFLEKGIPAVQLLTEPHLDYHRPGDTIARIDFSGLVRVATLASEAIQYLSQRPEPLTGAGPSPVSTPTGANDKTSRTVKTGTVPDFAFHGQGYRIGDITSGSAADRAGLQPGDIIIRVDDQIVASLTDFSRILKEHKPGDTIGLIYLRDGQQLETRLVLEAY